MQYNAMKPHKYHIKSFGLTDSHNGYVLNVLTYYRASTTNHEAVEPNSLYFPVLGKVSTSRQISGTYRKLVDYILAEKHHFTGTVNINRVGFPPALKRQRL